MSYDLAVWSGSRPASDDAAGQEYDRLLEQAEQEVAADADPQIVAFVTDLIDRVPDEPSPWAAERLLDDAAGSLLLVTMTADGARTAVPVCAKTAADHDLVCFDPQTGHVISPA